MNSKWKTVLTIAAVAGVGYVVWKKWGRDWWYSSSTPGLMTQSPTPGAPIMYTGTPVSTTSTTSTGETVMQKMKRLATVLIGASNMANYRIDYVKGQIINISTGKVTWNWLGSAWARASAIAAARTIRV